MNKMLALLCFMFFVLGCSSTQIVEFDDDDLAVMIANRANEYFDNKEYKKAIKAYQVIIDRFDPKNHEKDVAWAYYEIGFCHYYNKDYEMAIDYFNIVLQDFTIIAPRVLANIVLEDIYEVKPKLRPVIEENIDNITSEEIIIDDTIIN